MLMIFNNNQALPLTSLDLEMYVCMLEYVFLLNKGQIQKHVSLKQNILTHL